jgi:hypothetical protein
MKGSSMTTSSMTPKAIPRSASRSRGVVQRLRSRRRRRGALFVEALAVVLTIGFLLACISWFHSVYRTKGDTFAAARLDAWQRALPGCPLGAAETLLERSGERTSRAPGNGAFSDELQLRTQTTITCNEPAARDEPSLADALDSLYELVPWQPVDMARWFFGSGEPFAGMFSAVEFVGRSVNAAVLEVSNARDTLADRLGDVLAWTEQAVAGAFDWLL